jgi:hypothetical protein
VLGLTIGSLFAGIGGFDLGFERAGFTTRWQVERDSWCRENLAKNFPHAERYADIKDCGRANLTSVDIIVGGDPCQRNSNAARNGGGRKAPLPSSSVLLRNFAHALFSGRIQQLQGQMHLGLGGDSAENWSDLDTLCCPSDSGHVALALTTSENDCSCSPHYRTPTARDWKGMSAKSWRERTKGDTTPTLPDQLGGTPHPAFVEHLMGFPEGWTDLEHSETL